MISEVSGINGYFAGKNEKIAPALPKNFFGTEGKFTHIYMGV